MKEKKVSIFLTWIFIIASNTGYAGAHAVAVHTPGGSAGVVVGKTPAGRYYAVGGVKRNGSGVTVNAAIYNPYISYWSYYPTSNYYAGSFGYWSSSYGAYGQVYTQPGLYSSYFYGPYGYSSSYYTPTYGSHSGIVNFSYNRVPGQSLTVSGSGPFGGSFSFSGRRYY